VIKVKWRTRVRHFEKNNLLVDRNSHSQARSAVSCFERLRFPARGPLMDPAGKLLRTLAHLMGQVNPVVGIQ
jgi:hypothetical protein